MSTPQNKLPWWQRWEFAKRIADVPQQLATDVKETAHDLVDEPGEVPYRVSQRIDGYVRPRHRVTYPSPERRK